MELRFHEHTGHVLITVHLLYGSNFSCYQNVIAFILSLKIIETNSMSKTPGVSPH